MAVDNNGRWGGYDLQNGVYVPLRITDGGTGATNAAGARINLQVDRLSQSAGSTVLYTPSREVALTLQDTLWGVYKAGTNDTIPLGVYSGGTGATTEAAARINLQVDRVSQASDATSIRSADSAFYFYVNDARDWGAYDSTSRRFISLPVNRGGTGGSDSYTAAQNLHTYVQNVGSINTGTDFNNHNGIAGTAGVVASVNNGAVGATNFPTSYRRNAQLYGYGGLITTSYDIGNGVTSQMYISHRGQLAYRMKWGGGYVDSWCTSLDNSNTTIDANGFIKAASPIVKVFADGSSELNSESEGVVTKRVEMGVHAVLGTKGLNQDGWTIEIPQDVNGNRLCFVETSYDEENEVLTLRTFTRKFDISTAMVIAGEPMEIPSGRWIDLRVEMPADSIYNLRFPESQDEQNK